MAMVHFMAQSTKTMDNALAKLSHVIKLYSHYVATLLFTNKSCVIARKIVASPRFVETKLKHKYFDPLSSNKHILYFHEIMIKKIHCAMT